jgi:hypothetical protein
MLLFVKYPWGRHGLRRRQPSSRERVSQLNKVLINSICRALKLSFIFEPMAQTILCVKQAAP